MSTVGSLKKIYTRGSINNKVEGKFVKKEGKESSLKPVPSNGRGFSGRRSPYTKHNTKQHSSS